MSLDKCIPGLVESGQLTKEQGDHALAVYGRIARQHSRSMGAAAAEALASEETIAAIARKAAQDKRQKLLQIDAQKRALVSMAGFDNGSGKAPGAAAMALLDADRRAPYSNVEARRRAIVGRAHATISDVLEQFKRSSTGARRNVEDLNDVVRELFGTPTGNSPAAELAAAWSQAAEDLRRRFNAAGGAIGKLEKWGLPQSHDSLRVRKAGYQAWRARILPLLDRERMIDEATGLPFDDASLDVALKNVFDTIRTEGWIKRNPAGRLGKGKLANQGQEHRFLHFKDAEGWLEYNDAFGSGDAFEAMMGHIEGMSRDIAHMEILGPNPEATMHWLQDGLQKAAALEGEDGLIDSARWASFRLRQLYDVTSGAHSVPVHGRVARALGTVRSLLTSALLGSAALSAITDVGFQAVTRGFNGLPVTGALTGYLKQLKGANRRNAVRQGLIAEEASKIMAAQNRFGEGAQLHRWAGWLTDNVLRWSGLSPWTQGGRWAFGQEFLGVLADHFDHGFEALDPTISKTLSRYGIDADSWDRLRATKLHEEEGTTFLRPQDIEDERLGDRVLEMVLTETDYAVPTATARARSFTSVAPAGTFWGEVQRNALLFKNFGISMLMTHGMRAVSEGPWNGAKYAAAAVITTTLLGALALQTKEVAKGKDPRPMDNPDFWGASMLQGGGFGIFGDFLTSAEGRSGSSLAETAAGPVYGLGSDIVDVTLGNAFREWHHLTGRNADGTRPKGPNPGRQLSRSVGRYFPGSSLWYGRLAFQRIIQDTLQEWTDPDYRDAFRRMERKAQETDQSYWWRPGRALPDRAPEMGNSTGSQ